MKTQNAAKQFSFLSMVLLALLALLAVRSWSQDSEDEEDYSEPSVPGAGLSMPGAGMSSSSSPAPGAPKGAPPPDSSFVKEIMIGDYVELDDSMKNELYGTIDFPDAELKQIIKAISKLAKKNFILDKKIENRRITIISPVAVTNQEAYNAFLSALYMNDLTMVSEGKFLKIIDSKSAYQSNTRVFMGDYAPPSAEIVTVLYPLTHLNAEETYRFVQELVPRTGRVAAYPDTNTLVMTDTGLNLRRIIAILKSIDVSGQSEQLENIPIRYASAKDISKLIEDILDAQNPTRSRSSTIRRSGTKQKTRGGGVISKIVPDERTNSLVVLANGRGIQELRNLVNKLDTPNAAGGGNLHIYFCKQADAEKLSETLGKILSSNSKGNEVRGAAPRPGIGNDSSPSIGAASSVDGVQFDGNLKITADKATNSLIVVGSASDFSSLKRILAQLDAPRRQVYVEATIMEIKLDGSKDLGVITNISTPGVPTAGGFFPGSAPTSLSKLIASPIGLTGLVAGIGAGKKFTQTINGRKIKLNTITALISALVESTQAQIMQQPQILTSDNEDSEIKVTQKKSTLLKGASSGTNPIATETLNKENVEVSLKIKPHIGEGSDLIKLEVEQTMDDFAPAPDAAGQLDTTQRKAKTVVTVKNGDTVVIGGLQKQSSSDTQSKIPLLGDIPIIGRLFSGSSSDSSRSYMAIFLTPRVISNYSDLAVITDQVLAERQEVGKLASNPEDRQKDNVAKFKKKIREGSNDREARGFAPSNSKGGPGKSSYISQDGLEGEEPTVVPQKPDLMAEPLDLQSGSGDLPVEPTNIDQSFPDALASPEGN